MTPRDITTAWFNMDGLTKAYALVDERTAAGQCIWCGQPALGFHQILGYPLCSVDHGSQYIDWYCEVENK